MLPIVPPGQALVHVIVLRYVNLIFVWIYGSRCSIDIVDCVCGVTYRLQVFGRRWKTDCAGSRRERWLETRLSEQTASECLWMLICLSVMICLETLSQSLSLSWGLWFMVFVCISVLMITVSVLVLVLPLPSWSCVSRPRQFKTPDNWRVASLKTRCHYQLVDVQQFCQLIHFHLCLSHLLFSAVTDRKWMKHIHDVSLVSAKRDSIPSLIEVLRQSCLKTAASLPWSWSWRLLSYCLSPVPVLVVALTVLDLSLLSLCLYVCLSVCLVWSSWAVIS